ncbi:MAG: GAF domain-containing sensor histidine kinase [Actinomycetota bacterium]
MAQATRRLASLALEATGADRSAILERDPSGVRRLLPVAAASRNGDLRAMRERFLRMDPIDTTSSLERLGVLWERPRTTLIEDAPSTNLLPDEWKSWGSRSLAFTPLRCGGKMYGILAVDWVREPHEFSATDVRLLEAIAGAAGTALRGARLVETLENKLRLIEGLLRLSDAVARTSGPRTFLSRLNEAVGDEIGVRCTRLCIADAATAALIRVPLASAREIDLITRWRREPNPGIERRGERTAIPIPLGGRPAGILWVRADLPLDQSRLDLLRAAAVGLGEIAAKAKLRRMAERRQQELIVSAERERIARDLHDTVGQTLFRIGLGLQDVLLDVRDGELLQRLGGLRALAAQGVADVRSAVYTLSFSQVREHGFIPSLRTLARQFEISTGIPVSLRFSGDTRSLSTDGASALYRVAHEALVNVDRHARASGVAVALDRAGVNASLSIRDDGVGLDQRQGAHWQSATHFGMRAMARTVEEIGGRFRAREATPRGLIIEASVPLTAGCRK